jgi:hypothetical protein
VGGLCGDVDQVGGERPGGEAVEEPGLEPEPSALAVQEAELYGRIERVAVSDDDAAAS